MKEVIDAVIYRNEEIAPNIFDMLLQVGSIINDAKVGQFVEIYPDNNKNLLPRPISICEINKDNNTIRLVYQRIGEGTHLFSKMKMHTIVRMLGICGNGYKLFENKKHVLVGGGIGIPPLVETCKQLKGEKIAILGFRSGSFLVEDFKRTGAEVYVATDDGSVGFKGNVLELMQEKNILGDHIYACGPKPMLDGVTQFAKKHNIHAQVSMEERMACGVGACVGCVIKIMENGLPVFKKVCKEGPVFNATEVIFR